MKIFITGATGYIGQQLALKLAEKGHELHALIRNPAKGEIIKHSRILTFKGDLLNPDSIARAMESCELVFHIGAYAAIDPNPKIYYDVNVKGTQNVFEEALKSGIKKVVYTSTGGIFGPSDPDPVSEYDFRKVPFFNDYETSKFIAEEMALRFCRKGLDVVIVNPTRVYGPGFDSVSNAVTRLTRLYLKGIGRFLPGNGQKIGNYAFVGDVVNGHLLAMDSGIPGERYILGGENVSYLHLFDLIGELSGKKLRLFQIPNFVLIFAVGLMSNTSKLVGLKPKVTTEWTRKYLYNWALSSEKAESELGYTITPLRSGMEKTIAWIRENNQK